MLRKRLTSLALVGSLAVFGFACEGAAVEDPPVDDTLEDDAGDEAGDEAGEDAGDDA